MAFFNAAQLLKLVCLGLMALMSSAQPRNDCTRTCGSLAIPYPFGTEEGCYFDKTFLITCNESTSSPLPFLRRSNIHVLNISLEGELRVSTYIASECYNKSGYTVDSGSTGSSLTLSKFPLSSTRNKFTAVGCHTLAYINGTLEQEYTTGCISACDSTFNVVNGSCSGIGCCQTSIPGVRDYTVKFGTLSSNYSRVQDFNPCSYAFVVEDGFYSFSSLDLLNFQNRTSVPVVLDWAVGNETCPDAQKNLTSYACKANFSTCYNSHNGPGYRCNCSEGYQGNPYLLDGCTDIDECSVLKPCNQTCHNLPGNYSCSCRDGYEGDGYIEGSGCSPINNNRSNGLLVIALSISISVFVTMVGSSLIYLVFQKRKHMKLKEKYFKQNGGLMFQQQVSSHSHRGSVETAKIFTEEELKKATNNYDESLVLGQGGYGMVYKGVLSDNKMVAIKKSKIADQSQIEQFINEVIVLSQIIHKNIVKLLGCCLETEVPLLVYEFVTNGTLSDHIHEKSPTSSLSWESRLKVAAETAGALAYLHFDISMPIVHRDVKTTNILLDDNYTAKVADFGASRLVPLDESQLTTLVQGTWGYLDPEYFLTNQLTEKSDVYSFGVVLVELLTGKMALAFDRPEAERNLAMHFNSSMKEDKLMDILDNNMADEKNIQQIKKVAKLAKGCLRMKGEDRPTMKEVAMELEGLRLMNKHPWGKDQFSSEETEYLLCEPLNAYNAEFGTGVSGSSESGYDNMKNLAVPMDGGR